MRFLKFLLVPALALFCAFNSGAQTKQTVASPDGKIKVEVTLAGGMTYDVYRDGELVLDTELFGKWSITVSGGKCTVLPTDKDASVYVEGYRVYPFMFGPMSPFAAGVDLSAVSPEARALIHNWFPLPLYCLNFS